MEERFKTFTLLIANISRCIRKIKTEEMAEHQLKSPHVSCLYYLYKGRGMTFGELCSVCEEDKANVSRSVKYLEENGYLAGHDTKSSKRYHTPLELTEKGLCVSKMIVEKIDAVLDRASDGLSEESRRILYRSLSLVNDNLQRICDGYGLSETEN